MKKSVLLFLLLFVCLSTSFSQIVPDTTGKSALKNRPETEAREIPKIKEVRPVTAYDLKVKSAEQIQQLKKGILLVRLRTSEIAINNLRKSGKEQMAATMERQQEAANQRLMHAFQKNFKFCPVYFFFSSATDKVMQGETRGFLLNNKLKVDNQIALPDTNFFVAELTDLKQFQEDPNSPQANINEEISFRALVMRDKNFNQLANPFPYFIKASSNFPPRKRSEVEMVDLLNSRLKSYYKSVTGKSGNGK